MSPPFGSRFEAYVRPARRAPQLWRLAAGLILSVTVYIAAGVALIRLGGDLLAPESAGRPGPILTFLFGFGGLAVGVFAAAAIVHRRGPASLYGSSRRLVSDFLRAALCVGAVQLVAVAGAALLFGVTIRPDPELWLILLPATLAGLLIQTGTEELVFRGYLLQQLAARFRSPWVWGAGPSLLFGALHFTPSLPVGQALVLCAAVAVFGLIATELTAATGSLGAAWGLHFANNTAALALLSSQQDLSALALATTKVPDDRLGLLIVADALILLAGWRLTRAVLMR